MSSIALRPTLNDVLAHDGPETHMAVCVELCADTETPIAVFQRLAGERPNAFLLESAAGDEVMGRYSFFGYDIDTTFVVRHNRITIQRGATATEVHASDPLAAIRDLMNAYRVVSLPDAPRFQGGVVGYLGFDCVATMERVPLPANPGTDVPEAMLFLVTELCVYDHLTHRLMLITHIPLPGNRAESYEQAHQRLQATVARVSAEIHVRETPRLYETPPTLAEAITELDVQCSRDRAEMEQAITTARAAIARGEVFQIVVSQRVSAACDLPPLDVYRALREVSPAPYMFFLRFGELTVLGASPEMLVRLDQDDLLLCPIAGTRPRGQTPDADTALERELLADDKELAEHQMLVDLGRNDLGRVAQAGSVRVDRATRVVRYSHVMHIVSDVRARLAPGRDAYDVLRACFPAGTVSGAPKVRACELIAQLEPDRRGVYAGAVGYIDFQGNLDTCIAIRTLVIARGQASLQTGAGIVYDSIPANEVDECWNKARAGLVALAVAQRRSVAIPVGAAA
jgi:anthranilate synthase component 1